MQPTPMNTPNPSLADDTRWLITGGVLVYLVTLMARLSLWYHWDHPALQINGEFLLATHDSYYWLAKANGYGTMSDAPLAMLTWLVHTITGFKLGNIGFWGPAVMASFVAPVAFLWGWLIQGRSGGVIGGLAGAMTPGFYYRTRLGYYDTDLFTLLMPLLTAWLLAHWLGRHARVSWFSNNDEAPVAPNSAWYILGIGLFARLGGWWHNDIVNAQAILFFLATILGLVLAYPGRRGRMLAELGIFALAAFPGMAGGAYSIQPLGLVLKGLDTNTAIYLYSFTGIGFALLLTIFLQRPDGRERYDSWFAGGIVFLLAALISSTLTQPLLLVIPKLLVYLKPATDKAALGAPIYPSVTRSIIEVTNASWMNMLHRLAAYSWLTFIGFACTIVAVILRPRTVMLLPLVALAVMSVKLGTRFTMFGGAGIMICLGICVDMLGHTIFKDNRYATRLMVVFSSIVGLVIMLSWYGGYKKMGPTPVVTKQHAAALIELGKKAPKDAVVWTWWDWGYATQYYAGLYTPSDGGRHRGRELYSTALLMSTHSPMQAAQIIKFNAKHDYEPWKVWDKESGKTVQAYVNSLKKEQYLPFPTKKQYVVVSWSDMPISRWITHFGNWNLDTGKSRSFDLRSLPGSRIKTNLKKGIIRTRDSKDFALKRIDFLSPKELRRFHYANNYASPRLLRSMPFMVYNALSGRSLFMSPQIYGATMTQMFVQAPTNETYKPYFKLITNKLPFVRIYELVQ